MRDELGNRMKTYYEDIFRYKVMRRMPVIIRVDMRAGHYFTREMKEPYDLIFKNSMWMTACALCEKIMNVQIAYIQSDEISLLLTDYKKLSSSQWFDGVIQKMASVSASIATIEFNKAFQYSILHSDDYGEEYSDTQIYLNKLNNMNFDSRVFNIPDNEVNNYMIWRQKDATRNSILKAAYMYFSNDKIKNIPLNKLQDKLLTEVNVNWDKYPTFYKRGVCIYKSKDEHNKIEWIIDKEIPIFTKEITYINKFVYNPI